jgi:hypothetical protein
MSGNLLAWYAFRLGHPGAVGPGNEGLFWRKPVNKSALAVRLALLATSPLLLAACGDAVSGTWESDFKVGSHRDEFTIDGDLVGDGDFYVPPTGSIKCRGDITGTVKRDQEYRLKIQFKGGSGCDSLADLEVDCELIKDDTELDCGTEGGAWNRID